MTVYLDLVMGLNFLVDLLLLLGTGRITGTPTSGKRVLAASALGGVYGGVCLLPGFSFLGNTLWRLVSLGLMGWTAFGWNRGTGEKCCVFALLSMALGGIALCLNSGRMTVVLAAGLGLLLLCRSGKHREEREYQALELCHGEKRIRLTALRDTGNTLRDPVTGEPVIVISPGAAENLTGLTRGQLRNPVETLAQAPIPGLRLIPFRAVGGSGMMLAMKITDGKLEGKRCSPLVAFAPEGLGEEREFQALTGGGV